MSYWSIKVFLIKISDGQKSRIVFCELSLAKPNIILFDEPTNALDIETIDSLAEAINEFDGGVVLVSHDFRLISQVADQIWLCEDGVFLFLYLESHTLGRIHFRLQGSIKKGSQG